MTENTSMAISLGLFGATATYLFSAYGESLSLWAAFVSWACFFHAGGGLQSLKLTSACTIFGCALGWLTMLAITGEDAVGASNLLALSLAKNALFNISLSMLIGIIFGVATERLAILLTTKEVAQAQEN